MKTNITNNKVNYTFIKSVKFPKLPITTPFVFSYFDNDKFVLIYEKNQWGAIGGHVEKNETWKQTVLREALEEAGLELESKMTIKGYILAEQIIEDGRHPKKSILPVVFAKIKHIKNKWMEKDIKRKYFNKEEVMTVFNSRDDNGLFAQIFQQSVNS